MLVGRMYCICDDGLWILDEDDRGFLNLFYFLCFSFLALRFFNTPLVYNWERVVQETLCS